MNVFCTWAKCYRKIFFSHIVQMVRAKMNSYLNIPVYSLIYPSNIKYENKLNNQLLLHATYITGC